MRSCKFIDLDSYYIAEKIFSFSYIIGWFQE